MVSELAEFQRESAQKHRGNFPQDAAFILIPWDLIVEEAFLEITGQNWLP